MDLLTIFSIAHYFLVALLFLCFGSFLNVVAYRFNHDISFFKKRSECPHCSAIITWYDLIPVVSWILLKGRCRSCRKSISWLYPCIEIITLLSFLGLFFKINPRYFLGYSIFFAALIITIRTDLESMFILRYCTLFMIPVAFSLSLLQLLPLTPTQSIIGALCGYSILWIIRHLYLRATGLVGIGQGDLELLATVGAFLGPLNCWFTLLIGSFLGSIAGIVLIKSSFKKKQHKIAFGPYLAVGAIIVSIFQNELRVLLAAI